MATKTNSTPRRKPISRPAAPAVRRGKKKSKERIMPTWLRAILAVGIIAVFLPVFIGFSFARMLIAGSLVMVRKDMVSVCPVTMKCMALIFPIIKAV